VSEPSPRKDGATRLNGCVGQQSADRGIFPCRHERRYIQGTIRFFLNTAYDSDPGMPTRAELADLRHWNLGRCGSTPTYVQRGISRHIRGFMPGGGRMTWGDRGKPVEKRAYTSKTNATRVIARVLRLDYSFVRDHEYTVSGPSRILDRLRLPTRSSGSTCRGHFDLRFRPNGCSPSRIRRPCRVGYPHVWTSKVCARRGNVRPLASLRATPSAQRLAVEAAAVTRLRTGAAARAGSTSVTSRARRLGTSSPQVERHRRPCLWR